MSSLLFTARPVTVGCGGNELDYDFMVDKRLAPPVLADEREEPMFDLVPLARVWGKWQTEISSSISWASFCNSHFYSQPRAPLLPRIGVINKRFPCG